MYGRILHYYLMKSWKTLLFFGCTSYKLILHECHFSQCNCHLQVYHDVWSNLKSTLSHDFRYQHNPILVFKVHFMRSIDYNYSG